VSSTSASSMPMLELDHLLPIVPR